MTARPRHVPFGSRAGRQKILFNPPSLLIRELLPDITVDEIALGLRETIFQFIVNKIPFLDPAALFAENLDGLAGAVERGLATPEHAAFVARLAAPRRDEEPR